MRRRLNLSLALALTALLLATTAPWVAILRAAPAVLASVSAGSGSTVDVTTGSIDTTGATNIFGAVATYTVNADQALADSKFNTWTGLTAQATATGPRLHIYHCAQPCTVGTGHTFNAGDGATASYVSVCVVAVNGTTTTSPFDQQNGATGDIVSSLATGSAGFTSGAGIYFTAAAAQVTIGTSAVDSSFINQQEVDFAGGIHWSIACATKIAGGSESPTWTPSGGATNIAVSQGTFKEAAGTTNNTINRLLTGVGHF